MSSTDLNIREVYVEEELKRSYLNYAMSVIVGRAIPDVRDGLKPVQRRILYAMSKLGLVPQSRFRKSALVVGEITGKYHPHGGDAVYLAMVRLAQPFNMRYRLVLGQGNFGSTDGDGPAAQRYTEAKLEKISMELLEDINKEIIEFAPNYDGSLEEPVALPAKFPQLIVNGSSGIAVGMATNIPQHNLGEVIDATIAVIDNPELTAEDIFDQGFITGPDFPTGACIIKDGNLRNFYIHGHGSIKMKGVADIDISQKRERIIVREVPYGMNKAAWQVNLVELIKKEKLKDISDIRDESSRGETRVVIELKKGADAHIVLNQLYKYSSLQTTFAAKMLVVNNKYPEVMNIKTYLETFIRFRKHVIVKKHEYLLREAEKRIHILEGLKIALTNIDAVIKVIKASGSPAIAKAELMKSFSLSEIQSQAILDMKLQRLTSLEREKLLEEYEEQKKKIEEIKNILSKDELQYGIIKDELKVIKEKYGDPRRTSVIMDEGSYDIEDLIKDEDFMIIVTDNDYIKKVPLTAYREQKRGGKGSSVGIKEDDVVKHLFVVNSKDMIMFFTSDGNVHWLKTYEVPTGSTQAKGKPLVNYIDLKGRSLTNVMSVNEYGQGHLVFITKSGIIKRTEAKLFSNPRSTGIRAINLDEGDLLVDVLYSRDNEDILIESNVGYVIRFKQEDLSSLGRTARGVKGIKLRDGEEVVGMQLVKAGATVLTVTEKGYGKRTLLSEYPVIKRGGRGVIDIKTDERNGQVVTLLTVTQEDGLILVTRKKKIVRMRVADFNIIGRNTKGVKVARLDEDDSIISVEKVKTGQEEGI